MPSILTVIADIAGRPSRAQNLPWRLSLASSAASDLDQLAGAVFRVTLLMGTQAIGSSTGRTIPRGATQEISRPTPQKT
jgi:hypothetical protein